MACEICTRSTHEWYDCPKKPDGYVPLPLMRRVHQESTGLVMLARPGSSSSPRHNQVPESGSIPGPVDIKADRSIDRHRSGYYADYQRKRRARTKVEKA